MNLVETIVDAIWEGFEADPNAYADREMDAIDTGGHYESFSMQRIASAVLDALLEAQTIRTVSELHELPIPDPGALAGTLIKSVALVDPENGNYGLGEVYERNTDGTWCLLQDPSGADWDSRRVESRDVPLPVVVLWVPSS